MLIYYTALHCTFPCITLYMYYTMYVHERHYTCTCIALYMYSHYIVSFHTCTCNIHGITCITLYFCVHVLHCVTLYLYMYWVWLCIALLNKNDHCIRLASRFSSSYVKITPLIYIMCMWNSTSALCSRCKSSESFSSTLGDA